MMPELRPWTRQEMMKRVAFFKDLKGSKGGLPDSDLPECERELINVIGFQPPKEESAAVSPVGAESVPQFSDPDLGRVQPWLRPRQTWLRPPYAQSQHQ
jgi:hypothetical protein